MVHLEGDLLVVESDPEYYVKEESGLKPNTIQSIVDVIFDVPGLLTASVHPTHIEVINSASSGRRSFTRKLTDISAFGGYFIFSWEHRSERLCESCYNNGHLGCAACTYPAMVESCEHYRQISEEEIQERLEEIRESMDWSERGVLYG